MDLVPHIYHESQEPGSMLCGQHAINNLLQMNMYSAQDLAELARKLDELEAAQMDPETALAESSNYDDSGFFSIMVMEEALKVLSLRLVRWKSPEMKTLHNTPEKMEGFVLNHDLHWYTIRRFGSSERFYNLDSCKPAPEWISATLLGMTLHEAELRGYSIFAVLPTDDSNLSGLPPCDAAVTAQTLPPPSFGRNAAPTASTSKTPFTGAGNKLGSSLASSSAASLAKGKGKSAKRPPADDDDDDDDDDIIIVENGGKGTGSTSSVEEESEKRRRRRRIGDRPLPVSSGSASPVLPPVGSSNAVLNGVNGGGASELSEEDQMAMAIAESLRASKLNGEGKEGGAPVETEEKRRKGDADEDAELEAALKASLALSGDGEQEEEEGDGAEDDSPSVEELRRRRLARFG